MEAIVRYLFKHAKKYLCRNHSVVLGIANLESLSSRRIITDETFIHNLKSLFRKRENVQKKHPACDRLINHFTNADLDNGASIEL